MLNKIMDNIWEFKNYGAHWYAIPFEENNHWYNNMLVEGRLKGLHNVR